MKVMKYRNKFRISHVTLSLKNSIMTLAKGNVPTYITTDVMNRLNKGEQEIVIPMLIGLYDKSLVDYLNEYHRYQNKIWKLEFLHHAFMFTSEMLVKRLGRYKDIDIEILDISDTDKRVVIKMKEKERKKWQNKRSTTQ